MSLLHNLFSESSAETLCHWKSLGGSSEVSWIAAVPVVPAYQIGNSIGLDYSACKNSHDDQICFIKINNVVCKESFKVSLTCRSHVYLIAEACSSTKEWVSVLALCTRSKALMTLRTKRWTSANSLFGSSLLQKCRVRTLSQQILWHIRYHLSYRAGRKATETTKAV